MIESQPLDAVIYFDIVTHNPSTGAISDADSTPTFDVYENAVDTGMLGATNFTKRTSLTGDYRGTVTLSAANGFEVGKYYNVIASATVAAISAKKNCGTFRIVPAEATTGYPLVQTNAVTANALNASALATDAAQEIATALLDLAAGVETGVTLRQAQRLMLSALVAKLSGAATTSIAIRDVNDGKDRITATVDGSGNRTSVSLDAT